MTDLKNLKDLNQDLKQRFQHYPTSNLHLFTKRVCFDLEHLPNNVLYSFTEENNLFLYQNQPNKNFEEICTIYIPPNYPFHAPSVFYKGDLFQSIPLSNYEKLQVNQLLKINCLCCQNLFSPTKWSPVYTLSTIVKQLQRYHAFKKHIYKSILREIAIQRFFNMDDLYTHILSFF